MKQNFVHTRRGRHGEYLYGTPIPDKDNYISCQWDSKLNRYVSNAERWRRKRERLMDFEQLLAKLLELKETQPDLLKQKLNVIITTDDIQEIELSYTMGANQLVFIPSFNWE